MGFIGSLHRYRGNAESFSSAPSPNISVLLWNFNLDKPPSIRTFKSDTKTHKNKTLSADG
jgi:hypothetical protein